MRLVATLVTLAGAWSTPGFAQVAVPDSIRRAAASAPLFASHDSLTLTIQAPLNTIFKHRDQESDEYPGTVTHRQNDGRHVTLDVDIRTRGKSRLSRRLCQFPPLRLDFANDPATAGVFRGQDKLKLVAHCQNDRPEYEQYVLQEYLAYRVANLLTDLSFRVRLARITYVDTDATLDTLTRFGILIEDDDMMAARNGWQVLMAPAIPPEVADPDYLALLGVFQYLIGNPDWSAFHPEPGADQCCHNTRPVGSPADGPVFSVPYDFDLTGIVNPRYADGWFRPWERGLGIQVVRERVYRGFCSTTSRLPQVLTGFVGKKDSIYRLYREQAGLEPKIVRETLEYLDEFYRTISDPQRAERELIGKCRR
jgi:hypothetical protein